MRSGVALPRQSRTPVFGLTALTKLLAGTNQTSSGDESYEINSFLLYTYMTVI